MHTRVCDELGIEFPIFAFSHCRDVVAAVSRAGGVGVLGALYFTPDELEMELDWIDEHVDGKPYGVDLVMPATLLDAARGQRERRAAARAGPRADDPGGEPRVRREGPRGPRRPPAARRRAATPTTCSGGPTRPAAAQLDVALEHPARLLVNALGPPPADVVDKAHEHGMKVAALASTARHALKHQANGVDYIVAQGTEAGGHTGEISSVVLWPEVIEAVGPDTAVLAAGGIGRGSQVAAALAHGRAGRVDRLDVAHGPGGRHPPDGDGQDARGAIAGHRPLTCAHRQAGAAAPHRVDRCVRVGGLARLPADAAPVHARERRDDPDRPGRRTASSPGSRSGRSSGPSTPCARCAT